MKYVMVDSYTDDTEAWRTEGAAFVVTKHPIKVKSHLGSSGRAPHRVPEANSVRKNARMGTRSKELEI
jgi:hypothetical protein